MVMTCVYLQLRYFIMHISTSYTQWNAKQSFLTVFNSLSCQKSEMAAKVLHKLKVYGLRTGFERGYLLTHKHIS